MEDYSQEKMLAIFELCSILNLEDLQVAAALLKNVDWNLQKVFNDVNLFPTKKLQEIPLDQTVTNPFIYNNLEDDLSYPKIEYDFQYEDIKAIEQEEINNRKKKMFQEEYISLVELNKHRSEGYQEEKIKQIQKRKKEATSHQYRNVLMANSQQITNKILNSKKFSNTQRQKYLYSAKKTRLNKQFISYLHKKFHSQIDFTFGTFYSSLIRAHLDKKPLLVYIHKQMSENHNKIIKLFLSSKQIASVTRVRSECYGMFDNHDDYQIVQKHLPLNQLPAWALFTLNRSTNKEQFMAFYPILGNGQQNFLEWIANHLNFRLKRKQQTPVLNEKKSSFYHIRNQQDYLYSQTIKDYQLKKKISLDRKENQHQKQLLINQKKLIFQKYIKENKNILNIQFKIRMPTDGSSQLISFSGQDSIQLIFDYVDCYCRNKFEQKWVDFDLTQTFPNLSLKSQKDKKIKEIFQDSTRENLIIKQIY